MKTWNPADHPWQQFLMARLRAIVWLREVMGYPPQEILDSINADLEQLELLYMTAVEKRGDAPGERPIREARLEEENLGQARASLNFTLAELQTAQHERDAALRALDDADEVRDRMQQNLQKQWDELCAARAALREVLEEPIYQSRDVLDRWRRALGDAPGEGAR